MEGAMLQALVGVMARGSAADVQHVVREAVLSSVSEASSGKATGTQGVTAARRRTTAATAAGSTPVRERSAERSAGEPVARTRNDVEARRARCRQLVFGPLPPDNGGAGTLLHVAACAGNTDAVCGLLAVLNSGVLSDGVTAAGVIEFVNRPDPNGRTPLHAASLRGFDDVCRELLRAGADPNAQDRAGFSPLHVVSSEHVVATLCKSDSIDVLVQNKAGLTALEHLRRIGAAPAVINAVEIQTIEANGSLTALYRNPQTRAKMYFLVLLCGMAAFAAATFAALSGQDAPEQISHAEL
eukprot:m.155644 g.155644  ORF g.155644 m.155644 type:complete len:298 (-) comp17537_c0_seq4:51-944(-)